MKLNLSNDTAKTELSMVGDTNLMLRFQSGDDLCFRELVKRHRQRVYDYVYRLFRGSDEAGAIARDVFVALHRRRDRFRTSMDFNQWLIALCHEVCRGCHAPQKSVWGINRLRSRSGRRREPHIGYVSPAHDAAFTDSARRVKAAVDRLCATERELLILARYVNCPYEVIAGLTAMGVPEVRRVLNRVKFSLIVSLRRVLE